MHRSRIVTIAAAFLLLLTVNSFAQDDYFEISGVGYWTTTSDWEGDPIGLEWDSDFQFGFEGTATFDKFYLSGRWMFGTFDVTSPGTDDSWSLNNLEVFGGYRILDTPFSVLAAYKHWGLEFDEARGDVNPFGSLSFSFDGIGVGGGINWDSPQGYFFNGQAIYYFEADSSLDIIDERGFDMGLTFNGEVGILFAEGVTAAIGARFEQVHQDLPEEERVAPFIDYGFEQFSITARIGYRFGM